MVVEGDERSTEPREGDLMLAVVPPVPQRTAVGDVPQTDEARHGRPAVLADPVALTLASPRVDAYVGRRPVVVVRRSDPVVPARSNVTLA